MCCNGLDNALVAARDFEFARHVKDEVNCTSKVGWSLYSDPVPDMIALAVA